LNVQTQKARPFEAGNKKTLLFQLLLRQSEDWNRVGHKSRQHTCRPGRLAPVKGDII
jgi:hypothetical protein